jgi:hypothetical protein
MAEPYQALNIPPAATEQGGIEVLRCAVIDNNLHLTLRPVFNDPSAWGHTLAAVAQQVAAVYAHQGRFEASDMLARITEAFETAMKNPPDVAGAISPLGS